MSFKLLRFKDLQASGIARSWPMLRLRVRNDGFPTGFRLGGNSRAWREQDVEAWLASRPTGPKRYPKSFPPPRRKADADAVA